MEHGKEINFQQLFYTLVNKIWLIALSGVLFGAALYLYTDNFIPAQYRASVTFYVNNSASINETSQNVTTYDLTASQRLVNTYITILENRHEVMEKVADKVEERTGYRPSEASIRNMMSAGSVNETEVFKVSISNRDPVLATVIANAIADVAPGEIEAVIRGSSARVVDRARQPSAPYYPNKTTNTMYGVICGILIAVIYVIIRVLMDVRVKGEEDLARLSDAPVLGTIPDFDMDGKSGNYAYSGGKYYSSRSYASKDYSSKQEDDQ